MLIFLLLLLMSSFFSVNVAAEPNKILLETKNQEDYNLWFFGMKPNLYYLGPTEKILVPKNIEITDTLCMPLQIYQYYYTRSSEERQYRLFYLFYFVS